MKKSLLIGLSTTAVTIGVVGLAGIASAATSTTSGSTTSTSLVDKIASKFNLSKTDVQAVFDADRSEHETERQAQQKTRLDAAVKAGTITQAQEDQIIAKEQELHTYMDSLKDKTEDERRSAMKTKMDEFRQWLSDNNIPQNIVRGMGGRGGHDGPPPDDSSTSSTSTSNNSTQ